MIEDLCKEQLREEIDLGFDFVGGCKDLLPNTPIQPPSVSASKRYLTGQYAADMAKKAMQAKTKFNSWTDVEQLLGIEKKTLYRLRKKFKLDES